MAKIVFGMNQSLDGYVDHQELPAPGPALFRHWIEHVRDLTGSVYGRRMYEAMRYWDEDRPEWSAEQHEFAAAWRRQPKWVVSRSLKSVGPNATLVEDDVEAVIRGLKARLVGEIAVSGPDLHQSVELEIKSRVAIRECESFDEAVLLAAQDQATSNGTTYPVVLFRQGHRPTLTGAMAMQQIQKYITLENKAKKGASPNDVTVEKNRPVMEDHVTVIADYLKKFAGVPDSEELHSERGKYIIPAVTLNANVPLRVYTVPSQSSVKIAFLVLPDTVKLDTTDGQHRLRAILKAILGMSEADRDYFKKDAISFMLTCETNPTQVHQDFADCSKTKAIPPSMLTVYDRRPPVNRLVIDLINSCALFTDKIDSTSKSIGKNSVCLFVTNQVRQLVKVLLTGDVAISEASFIKNADVIMKTDAEISEKLDKFIEFINYVTERLPEWKQASLIKRGLDMTKVKLLREKKLVCFTATGLNIIGRIGHDILFNSDITDWKPYAEKLATIKGVNADGKQVPGWDKTNVLWKDIFSLKLSKKNELVPQIATQRGPVERATAALRLAIGLELEPERETAAEGYVDPKVKGEAATPVSV